MKIGIVIGLKSENESMWINGIKLNALNLSKMLNQIPGNDVYILDANNVVEDMTKVSWDYNKYKVAKFHKMKNEIDLLFMLGASLPSRTILELKLKNPKIKIVKYQCGNSYVVDMETCLFGDGEKDTKASWDRFHDETWVIPQQEYNNIEYYRTIYKQKGDRVKVVPFIWDPEPLDEHDKKIIKAGLPTPKYTPKKASEKRISVMEPNLNVVKFAGIPIMIAENVFSEFGPDAFKIINIGSGNRLIQHEYFKSMVSNLDITKHNLDGKSENKIKFVPRYPVSTFLSSATDIVLSHQWANPLNYSYLDAMYYGYPLVHNAEMIKDSGYYYSDFNISEGAEKLKYALDHHDDNLEEYTEKNKSVLNRYLSTNPDVVAIYKKLIENLFEIDNHPLTYDYDWKTNLYK
jgi:hypothetical protein